MKVLQQTNLEVKDPPMNDGKVILLITLLNSGRLDDIPARLDHVQLDQPVEPRRIILDLVELLLVQTIHVANVPEPRVEDAQIGGRQGGLHSSAVVVAADDDVLDAQVSHGVVDDRHDVQVDRRHEVGNVAVDEDLSGVEAHDLVGGHPAVAAADVSASVSLARRRLSRFGIRGINTGNQAAGRSRACRRKPDRPPSSKRPISGCFRKSARGTAADTDGRSAGRGTGPYRGRDRNSKLVRVLRFEEQEYPGCAGGE